MKLRMHTGVIGYGRPLLRDGGRNLPQLGINIFLGQTNLLQDPPGILQK